MPRDPRASALALATILTLAGAGSTTVAHGEAAQALTASAGGGSVSVFSDAYKAESTPVVVGTLRYTRQMSARWSGTGLYVNCLGGLFSGYSLGVSFDSRNVHQSGGELTNQGVREVESVPKWLFRASLTGGFWQYLNALTKANPRPGEDKKAPVQADLYGFALGGSVQRFLSEKQSLGLELINISTFAQSFSVNAQVLTFGYYYYY